MTRTMLLGVALCGFGVIFIRHYETHRINDNLSTSMHLSALEEEYGDGLTISSQLWNKLGDPGQLIRYAAYHQYRKTMDSENRRWTGMETGSHPLIDKDDDRTLTDDLFYPLNCDIYDDDDVYPSEICLRGDNITCHEDVYVNSDYNASCSHACHNGWGVPCGWEAVRHLRQVCNGTFHAHMPTHSKNIEPSLAGSGAIGPNLFINSTGEQYWACNVHSFCYSCVEDGKVNDFCKAAVIRTKSLYAPAAVFKYLESYWCDHAIINYILNGTFCGWAVDKMSKCVDKGEVA